jgi:hypothetical protein
MNPLYNKGSTRCKETTWKIYPISFLPHARAFILRIKMYKSIVTNNEKVMKKILIILAVVSLTGCKTEYIYLTVFPVKGVTEITDTIYVASDNRFKMDFQKADSIFSVIEKASDDAMKSAILKFKR